MNNRRRRRLLIKVAQIPFGSLKGYASQLKNGAVGQSARKNKRLLTDRARLRNMDNMASKNIASTVGGIGGLVAKDKYDTFRMAARQRRKAAELAKKRMGTFKSIANSAAFKKLTGNNNTQAVTKKPKASGINPVVKGAKPPNTLGESLKVSPGASDLSGAVRGKTSPAQLAERRNLTPGGTNFQIDKLKAFRSGLRTAGGTMGVRMGNRGKL